MPSLKTGGSPPGQLFMPAQDIEVTMARETDSGGTNVLQKIYPT